MKKKELEAAFAHLKKDPDLQPFLRKETAPPVRRRGKDAFASLVRSIIYQQLSGKAAGTILARFLALFENTPFPTPAQVLALPDDAFRSVGISKQKMTYLRDLAKRFLDGTIEPAKFPKMSDEEIREHLIVVKGIGRWTADMFLMFTLYRPDVLPTGDLGIQKGFQKVFNLRTVPNPKRMETLAKAWAPYRTVASWYLWRIVDGEDADW